MSIYRVILNDEVVAYNEQLYYARCYAKEIGGIVDFDLEIQQFFVKLKAK